MHEFKQKALITGLFAFLMKIETFTFLRFCCLEYLNREIDVFRFCACLLLIPTVDFPPPKLEGVWLYPPPLVHELDNFRISEAKLYFYSFNCFSV